MNVLLLTIITITKDDPTGLKRTLVSTAAMRFDARIEQIVVDGDGGARQETEAAGCHWIKQVGTGISGAFNEGMDAACGEWVWFLNGGDTVYETLKPDWLLTLLQKTRAQVITGSIQWNGESTPRKLPHMSYQWPLIGCWLAHPATIVRRETLLEVKGFDERRRIAMDYDLWLRMLRRPIVVDVISVPFACFDVSGISSRPSQQSAVKREQAVIILKYSCHLICACGWLSLRLARRIIWALVRLCIPKGKRVGRLLL